MICTSILNAEDHVLDTQLYTRYKNGSAENKWTFGVGIQKISNMLLM
jgi:hypothetical protein